MFDVKLAHDAALGEGDRKAGEVLGALVPAKGVELRELLNALRNPDLVVIEPAADKKGK
jgi:hypothetical protein